MDKRGSKFCRGCDTSLGDVVLSLGNQPLSNALPSLDYQGLDSRFPLEFRVCSNCSLGQIGEYVSPKGIFSEYTYFSSTSSSWLEHAKNFANLATKKLNLERDDLVVEIASNDGYLLQYFQELGCQVIGIEPAKNVAKFANAKGIPTRVEFFGVESAQSLISRGEIPKLVVGNNVLAHVPDIKDFLGGLSLLAQHGAVISIEAPSMLIMLRDNLFDTIYHEHFSYLSVTSVDFLAKCHNLNLLDVQMLETHGGSYRYWLGIKESEAQPSVQAFKALELEFGISQAQTLSDFALKSNSVIKEFAEWVNAQDSPLVGYGAAAKATVLLNAAAINSERFDAVVDNAPSKQGRFIPGCRIPIKSADEVFRNTNGNLIIFPWNITTEISKSIKMDYPDFSGEIWVALPSLRKIN
jgi:hypothetical protein